jgi:hypothetical protein
MVLTRIAELYNTCPPSLPTNPATLAFDFMLLFRAPLRVYLPLGPLPVSAKVTSP